MLAELSYPHAFYLVQDVRVPDIRFASLVYLPCLRVPIAHLRQNKPFPLLYLGHAQIIRVRALSSCGYNCSFHVERCHALERLRFTFTAKGKLQTQVENFSEWKISR